MKTEVFFGIAFRIIILFTIAMIGTFIPDHFREFFGDRLKSYPNGTIDDNWDWGARHYWYFWMMSLLFLLAIINVVIGIVKLVEKHYDI